MNQYKIEDIVQQTVMKFLFRGKNTSNIKYLSSYVYTSLSNSAIDYFKKIGILGCIMTLIASFIYMFGIINIVTPLYMMLNVPLALQKTVFTLF